MVNAVCTPHAQIAITLPSLATKMLCISGVQMNNLATTKHCTAGCKVGQISSRGIKNYTLAMIVRACSKICCRCNNTRLDSRQRSDEFNFQT